MSNLILEKIKRVFFYDRIGFWHDAIYFVFQRKRLYDWEKSGRTASVPYIVKQRIVKEFAERYSAKILIETGTYLGDMIHANMNVFSAIFSIELNEALFFKAKKRFVRRPHITILRGDSGEVLPRIMEKAQEPCLFWLDSTYSGGITSRGNVDTPVFRELALIFNSSLKRYAVLTNADNIAVMADKDAAWKSMKDLVAKHRPDWKCEMKDGVIRIYA